MLIAFGTTLLFGLAPALRLVRPDLQASLKAGSPNMAGAGGGGFQSLIVVAEVALAVVLLMGAGLMIRTFWSLSRVDPGFRSANVLTLGVSPARVKYPQPEDQIRLYDEMLSEIRRLPGVQAAGAVRILPLAREMGDWGLTIEGYTPPHGGKVNAAWQAATPGYFEALRIPVREGRVFTVADRRDAQPVVVISETFARNFWPGQSALGHRIKIGQSTSPWSTIVGVVGEAVSQSMGLVAIGLALGLVAALALTHFLNSLLYGVKAQDPGTISASVFALGLVALLAAYLPARAAAAVDPMIALRGE